jgi:hypothetical protein
VTAKPVLDWLLQEDQPAVRALALTGILGKGRDDPEVETARENATQAGWAADLLARQSGDGTWAGGESLYRPKYLSTNWMLLILADLGLTKVDPRIRRACDLWLDRFAKDDGGFAMEGSKTGHLCTTGNTARAAVRLGYAEDPRVRRAFDWIAKTRDKNGGWSCFGSGRNLDSWEGLSAFAEYPKSKWTADMTRAVELGAEFFLQRELHKQGGPYAPWNRFHYPVHYYYDLLVGLEVLTSLGYGDDPRLRHAVSILTDRRRRDGRWNLDAVHPDLEGKMAEWYAKNPKRAPTPFALETPGEPSKMITLRALVVLDRIERGTRRGRP